MDADVASAQGWLVGQAPSRQHRRAALVLTILMLLAFAAVAPFSAQPLAQLNALFPSLNALVFVTDLVTAVLLFAQYTIWRSRALFALACGYLFTALIVVPHSLTFAGAFSPTGLLGANAQTGSWLFIFWHLGFGVALLAYALLRQAPVIERKGGAVARSIAIAAVALVLTVCFITWLSTAGTWLLPTIVSGQTLSPFVKVPIGLTIAVSGAALLLLFRGPRSVLDLWLQVVLLIYILELAFSGLMPTVRFSAGFYAGRFFSVVTSSLVLIVLLTETTRLYSRLARSHAALMRERDNRMMNLETMAAAIAHEVNQPLNAVSTYVAAALRFLQRKDPDVHAAEASIAKANAACARAGGVFTDIRSLFSRSETPRAEVDVNGLVLLALNAVDGDLRARGVTTSLRQAPDLPPVLGHEGELEHVLLNLVTNAIEAMHGVPGRRLLTVTTALHNGTDVEIEVADTGPGVEPTKVTQIFEAFVTTKATGMGLGLSICRLIVERHGGTLSLATDRTHGAAFRLRLPGAGQAKLRMSA
jgi:signal transduction histidine kinase